MPKVSRMTRQSNVAAAGAAAVPDESNNRSEATAKVTKPKRAALGDVSNRRSTRLSTKRDDSSKELAASQRDSDENELSGGEKRSLRSSAKNDDAGTSTATTSTRARSNSRSSEIGQPKAKKARVSKTKKSSGAAKKKPRAATSRLRARPPTRDIYKKSGMDHLKKELALSGRGRPATSTLCSDFLAKTDYKLVRRPFDSWKYTAGIASHDERHRKSDIEVSSYVTDIFQRLYHEETTTRPHLYIDSQEDINARMRSILVDWLVEVHMKFRLVPETLYLCVNIIDRYCSLVPVKRSRLQLVGVTALLLACKYEEIYPPEVRDCVYITDRAYTRQEVLDMEQHIVKTLEFKLTVPTAFPFLTRFLDLTQAGEVVKTASNYYLERTLQEHDVLEFRPSLLAAAAVTLAFNNPDVRQKDELPVRRPGIPHVLMAYTGFTSSEIIRSASLMARKVGEEVTTASRRQLVAVKRKYDHRKHQNISTELLDPDVDYIPNNYDDESDMY